MSGILDQRTFVVAAAICLGIGLISSYVDIQDRADRELALRLGAPNPVSIQDFERKVHSGRAGEVLVYGEADIDAAVVVTMQTVVADLQVLAIPVLPVSDTGVALIGAEGGPANDTLTDQAVRRATTEAETPEVVAVVVLPFDAAVKAGSDTYFFASEVYGEGRYGTVVKLNGDLEAPDDVAFDIHGALSVRNSNIANELTTIWPYLNGRVVALSQSRPLTEYKRFYILAGILAAIGGLLHLRNSPSLFWWTPKPVVEEDEDDWVEDRPTGSHPMFARIPSQTEISEAEHKSAEARAVEEASQSVLTVLTQYGSAFFKRRKSAVKNPPSHSEDELL